MPNLETSFRWDGDVLNLVATYNTPPAFSELRSRSPFRPDPKNPIGRMMSTKAVVHVVDLAAERRYVEGAIRMSSSPSNLGVYGRLWLSRC